MPSIRPALTAAAVAALLAVSATACGPTDDSADSKPSASASTSGTDGLKLPTSLPTTAEDLDKWKDALKNGGWENWDKEKWLRDAADFINPIIEDLWDADRLREADKTPSQDQDDSDVSDADDGTTDPQPAAVTAKQLSTPYHSASPATGKLLFDMPEGQAVCSATVVSDPANPGRSNLVWTAGHCVHAGAEGGWYRNVVFVPSFNDTGLTGSALKAATTSQLAPYGTWWAQEAGTTQEWIDEGGESSATSSAYPYDFAVLKVTNPDSGKSLEETVGASVPVWFNAPTAEGIDSLQARGYPAAAPFDGFGYQQYSCTDDPVRLKLTSDSPTMHWLGCTMTAGSSGGGWLTETPDGTTALVSNTSIGPAKGNTWLAGPYLGDQAEALFDKVRTS